MLFIENYKTVRSRIFESSNLLEVEFIVVYCKLVNVFFEAIINIENRCNCSLKSFLLHM